MNLKNDKHTIRSLEYLTEKEYNEINQLQSLCHEKDQTNLKLELDYKLFVGKNMTTASNKRNEFLYYVDDTLVSYLGVSCFGGNVGELNGMTHPDWRRQGIFKKLLDCAAAECSTRNFSKVVLLTDHNSASGVGFIQATGGCYDFSEYRMQLNTNISTPTFEDRKDATEANDAVSKSILVREATKADYKELKHQNALLFHDPEDTEDTADNDTPPGTFTYMVELQGKSIGKINVEYDSSNSFAFIFGFGILPEYRGKGYGKAALRKTLMAIQEKGAKDVQLDVVCTNSTALNLYKYCGFEERSVMDYFSFDV